MLMVVLLQDVVAEGGRFDLYLYLGMTLQSDCGNG